MRRLVWTRTIRAVRTTLMLAAFVGVGALSSIGGCQKDQEPPIKSAEDTAVDDTTRSDTALEDTVLEDTALDDTTPGDTSGPIDADGIGAGRPCCLDGACQLQSESTCDQNGGIWFPSKKSCGALSCNNKPCCHDDNCQEIPPLLCRQIDGTISDAESCGANTCEQATGADVACCLDSGCQMLTETKCGAVGGKAFPDLTCQNTPCQSGNTMPCCLPDGICEKRAKLKCADAGGQPIVGASSCNNVDCRTEKTPCCLAGACQVMERQQCRSQVGGVLAPVTNCKNVKCPEPVTAACCTLDASCKVTTERKCFDQLGDFRANTSQCSEVDCSSSVPCCARGICRMASSKMECKDSMNGTPKAASSCDEVVECSKPDRAWACCAPSGSIGADCAYLTPQECKDEGGTAHDQKTCDQISCSN